MRICIYTKKLTQRLDEGIARVAHEMVNRLVEHDEVLVLFSTGDVIEKDGMKRITTNRSGLDVRLRAEIMRFRPDVILYIARGSAGLPSLFLARVLKWYGGGADVVILAPQTKGFRSKLSRKCTPLLKPDLILTTSGKDQRELVSLGCAARFVPLGVDVERFTPATPDKKRELRRTYGFDEEEPIVLHVGHIREGRNLRALGPIQDKGNHVVIAGSTFSPHDAHLVDDLKAHGIRLLTGYNDHIEEIYQLADWYIFPTISEKACISQPLSVLEAMACNLPVVSTRFGGLPDLFPGEGGGLFYADSTSEIAAKSEYLRDNLRHVHPRTREMVEPYSWERSSQEIRRLLKDSRAMSIGVASNGKDVSHPSRGIG
jgi:glycosyltransferase involved in cell wall biosynthesis